MGTFLVLDIPKVPSDSTIWELRKSIFGIFGIKNLSRLDSRDMCCGSRRRYFVNAHAEGHNNIHAKIIFIIDANPVISTIHTLDILRRTDFTIY